MSGSRGALDQRGGRNRGCGGGAGGGQASGDEAGEDDESEEGEREVLVFHDVVDGYEKGRRAERGARLQSVREYSPL